MIDRILDLMQARGLMASEADARAIIEAMREPTQEMMLAATACYEGDIGSIWREMIDAAIAES